MIETLDKDNKLDNAQLLRLNRYCNQLQLVYKKLNWTWCGSHKTPNGMAIFVTYISMLKGLFEDFNSRCDKEGDSTTGGLIVKIAKKMMADTK